MITWMIFLTLMRLMKSNFVWSKPLLFKKRGQSVFLKDLYNLKTQYWCIYIKVYVIKRQCSIIYELEHIYYYKEEN